MFMNSSRESIILHSHSYEDVYQVEERLAREEHLIWLLNAMTAYIYCASPDFTDDDYLRFMERNPVHVGPPVVKEIGESAIIALLEYHLNNDSVFDVSEHMELYQVNHSWMLSSISWKQISFLISLTFYSYS